MFDTGYTIGRLRQYTGSICIHQKDMSCYMAEQA